MKQMTEGAMKQLFPVKEGMGGVQKKPDLVDRLVTGMSDQFKGALMKTLKDHPKVEEWGHGLDKDVKERVDRTKRKDT